MKVAIDKAYPIAAPPAATWAVLRDVEAVASCMPGAKITEHIDERHYKGTVTVRVGPATLTFRGEIEVAGIDEGAQSIHLVAKGTDTTGSSAASMDLTAGVAAAEGGTSLLKGACETSMSGKAAAFGGRLMGSVADQVLEQFARNFAARVAAAAPAAGSDRSGASSASSTAPPPAKELDGLALAWAALKNWWRGLFTKNAG
jgi:carbon monoxide dehydrogenase subunit G